jgi:hypothetical protein
MSDLSNDATTKKAPVKAPRRRADAKVKPEARSRVGNGKTLLAGIDTHSREYREYRDCVADLVEHMGSEPTAVQRAIIEEAAGLVVWCRSQRLALLKGEPFEIGPYTTATNALRRLLEDIGQERRLKDVTPDTVESIMAEYAEVGKLEAEKRAREKSTGGKDESLAPSRDSETSPRPPR